MLSFSEFSLQKELFLVVIIHIYEKKIFTPLCDGKTNHIIINIILSRCIINNKAVQLN